MPLDDLRTICAAYEDGYCTGMICEDDQNPYPPDTDTHNAYAIGYNAGLTSQANRQVFII